MPSLLGVDYGLVRIGLALADLETGLARPFRTLDARKGLLPALRSVVKEEDVIRVILGRPTRSQGEPGSLDAQILHFASVLEREGLDVDFQEEAFSSTRAQRLIDDRRSQGFKDGLAGGIDAVAAMIILQDWLDGDEEEIEEEGEQGEC